MHVAACLLLLAALVLPGLARADPVPYEAERSAMVKLVQRELQGIHRGTEIPTPDARVLAALATVPRHEFVSPDWRRHAYENRPLPIGHGQTISQPLIVAYMTELLECAEGSRVLEIGTGSGYQAAVLAQLGARVHTIEIVAALGEAARERFKRLGYARVETRIGDGYDGWKEAAPFDGIIVTAAANHIPPPLLEQLKPGGRMVIPLGNPFGTQHLVVVRKDDSGRVTTRKVLPVRFVPLTGRAEQ
jgi:protein-L-isoaspartate(D-aspartate) O-methyltransferase